MKTSTTIVGISAALALTCAGMRPRVPLRAGPPNDDSQSTVEESLTKSQTAADGPSATSQEQPERAQAQIEAQLAEANSQLALAEVQVAQAPVAAAASSAEDPAETMSGLTYQLQNLAHRTHGSGKALVIRSSEFDSKEQAGLEEDLAVMSHILDKALEEKLSSRPHAHKAMGIDVVFGSSSSPIRSLYLDGYGAVFLLNVSFPLLPPPKGEPRSEKSETSSTWEEARQELYGQRGEGKLAAAPAEEYDQDKVNSLKDALLEALKNGSNIRDLKADDSVTICVFGGAGGPPKAQSVVKRGPAATDYQNRVWVFGDSKTGHTRGTILTIRVRKSDAEAFAKGKLNLDEFRKKAKITAYAGNAAGDGGMGFGGGGGGYGFWQAR